MTESLTVSVYSGADLPYCPEDSARNPPSVWQHLTVAEKLSIVRPLWDEGMPVTQIAKHMGVGKNHILGFAHRNRFPARENSIGKGHPSPWATKERVDLVRERIAQGVVWREIFDELVTTPGDPVPVCHLGGPAWKRVRDWFNNHGVYQLYRHKATWVDRRAQAPRPAFAVSKPVYQPGEREKPKKKHPDRRAPDPDVKKKIIGVPECLWTGGEKGSYWNCTAPCEPKGYTDGFKPFCAYHAQFGYKGLACE